MVNNANSLAHNLIATLICGKNNLARRAKEEQAVYASLNETINRALKRHNIKLMVWGIWGYNWWNNTANGTLLDMLYPFTRWKIQLVSYNNVLK